MNAPHGGLYRLLLVTALLVTSCVHSPPEVEAPSPPPSASPPPVEEPITPSSFELRRREQAQTLGEQGRWAEAAAEWEILSLLRPDRAEYRTELKNARTRIEKAVSERLRSASDARLRGETDRAQLSYLKVLSLDPENAIAAHGLREIEAERTRRNRSSRPVAVAKLDKSPQSSAAAEPSASAPERRDLDFGNMLLRQGEYAASIKLFETYVKAYPKDAVGRRYLADAYLQLGQQRLQQGKKEEALLYLERASRMKGNDAPEIKGTLSSLRKALAEEHYQSGLRVHAADISEAIAQWEHAVRYDPSHVNARVRLQKAHQMERNLRAIEGSANRR